jgi:isopentenyl-diphosphate delta-isomerase
MRDNEERVVLVDLDDQVIGCEAKLPAHRRGVRHRAFSTFLFDSSGAVLLQARAHGKYHSGGLWSNACCGHPRVGEPSQAAAERRLYEEMCVHVPLRPAGIFSYCAELGGGWRENEIVHLFTGVCRSIPDPDPAEVGAWRWADPLALASEHRTRPDRFTAWFSIYVAQLPWAALGGPRESEGMAESMCLNLLPETA